MRYYARGGALYFEIVSIPLYYRQFTYLLPTHKAEGQFHEIILKLFKCFVLSLTENNFAFKFFCQGKSQLYKKSTF